MRKPSWTDAAADLRGKALSLVWGDRVGLFVFLGSLCLFGLVWRTGFLISDSYTIVNGLYALEQGSLHMTTVAYGPGLETPGTSVHDGKLFARNYGVIFAALPVVYVLEGLALVADLRIALVAGWCLLVLATVVLAGRITGHRRYAAYGGSVAVLLLFAGNVAFATPLDPPQYHLLALQIVHMVAAAFVGVFTYRLVSEVHDRRRAIAATVLVTLGTPLAFWAPVPKRHVVTAAVALGVAYAIARSRDGDRPYATLSRALAYALVGALAWVHAPEALVLLVALAVVDVPTAPANDARSLTIVGAAFFVSLLPMLATNAAISGDPFQVPRMLADATPGEGSLDAGGPSDAGDGPGAQSRNSADGAGGGDLYRSVVHPVVLLAVGLFQSVLEPLSTLASLLSRGLSNVVTRPERLYHVFVRSGYVERVAQNATGAPAANLSLLESAPVLAGVLAVVPLARARARSGIRLRGSLDFITPTDAFVIVLALAYAPVYVPRLPIHAQYTMRYLFVLYPLGVYGLVRLPPVGAVLTDHWRTFAWTYAGAILIGSQVLLVALVFLAPGRGEAYQIHALLALATVGVVGFWGVSGPTTARRGQFGAASLAVATAAATTFVLFDALEYHSFGDSHVLPMVRLVAELVSIV